MKNHILFPTDFSEAAEHAFQFALMLAGRLQARIDLISVYNLPINDAARYPPDEIEAQLREKREAVVQKLSRIAEQYPERTGKIRADYGVFVYQEICDAARDEGASLIVMGTKGERNPLEELMGSVTTHTLLHAPCPVIAVPPSSPIGPISDIAYATDFEPGDDHAVAQLTAFAEMLQSKVHFVHVDTSRGRAAPEQMQVSGYPLPFADFTVIYHPQPAAGIEGYLEEQDIGMLALFMPNRHFWERLFHRSFTKKMAFHTRAPLLVFNA